MIVLIDNHDETQIINKLEKATYKEYPTEQNAAICEKIADTLEKMDNTETKKDHEELESLIFMLDDQKLLGRVYNVLNEYGFAVEELEWTGKKDKK